MGPAHPDPAATAGAGFDEAAAGALDHRERDLEVTQAAERSFGSQMQVAPPHHLAKAQGLARDPRNGLLVEHASQFGAREVIGRHGDLEPENTTAVRA